MFGQSATVDMRLEHFTKYLRYYHKNRINPALFNVRILSDNCHESHKTTIKSGKSHVFSYILYVTLWMWGFVLIFCVSADIMCDAWSVMRGAWLLRILIYYIHTQERVKMSICI